MRLLSDEKVKQAIRTFFGDTSMQVAIMANNLVESIPSENDWIPVTERLPEEDGKYLCTITHEKFGYHEVRRCLCCIDRFYFYDLYPGEKVTAWMPLPEPYREEVKKK